MEITIFVDSVINDLASKFLQELGETSPMPPRGTVVQSLNESEARIHLICGRFLNSAISEGADDTLGVAECYVYDFNLTSRRAAGKAQPVTDTMHSFLVNATLAKTYSSLGQPELSAKHDAQATSDAQILDQLLRTKTPPQL